MKENEANGVKWLSVVESAKYLDMSRPRFEALVNAGYIRYYAMPSTGNGGLAGLADHYGVEFTPHNALSDAQAARTIYHLMQADLADRLASAKEGR